MGETLGSSLPREVFLDHAGYGDWKELFKIPLMLLAHVKVIDRRIYGSMRLHMDRVSGGLVRNVNPQVGIPLFRIQC